MTMSLEYARKYYANNKTALNEYHRQYAHGWRHRNRAKAMYSRTRGNALTKGLEFSLTSDWFVEKLAAGKCDVTGLPFDLSPATRQRRNPMGPTVDRRDPGRGYHADNCCMVVWVYNMAKSTWTHEIVMTMARALLEKTNG